MSRADPRVLAFLTSDKQIPSVGATNVIPITDARPRELPLGDPPRVVELPKRRRAPPAVSPDTSPSFERAWTHYATLDGLRRSTRRLSWPQWVIVARVHGEAALEAAVGVFVQDPTAREQAAKYGAPGFQVWLRQGRWEHYLGEQAAPTFEAPTAPRVFPDSSLRASFRLRFPDERAHRWFDRCGWDVDERAILFPNQALKQEWVEGPFRAWMQSNDVRVIRWA
jgi:hypothetical protein